MAQGIINRIAIVPDNQRVRAIILLEGTNQILEGVVNNAVARPLPDLNPVFSVTLTKPGDEVSFSYSEDFVNTFRNFKNLTLEKELSKGISPE